MRMNGLKEYRTKALAWAKEHLRGTVMYEPQSGKEVVFTMKGIKEAVNQPHVHYLEKLEAIPHIVDLFEDSVYAGQSLDESRSDYVYRYYATTIADEISFIVIRETLYTGLVDFYSIVDKIKE